eukprot:1161178-Pelagomonas_calceolata.AAC.1
MQGANSLHIAAAGAREAGCVPSLCPAAHAALPAACALLHAVREAGACPCTAGSSGGRCKKCPEWERAYYSRTSILKLRFGVLFMLDAPLSWALTYFKALQCPLHAWCSLVLRGMFSFDVQLQGGRVRPQFGASDFSAMSVTFNVVCLPGISK